MFKKALALTLSLSLYSPALLAQEREESLVMSVGDSLRKNWNSTLFSIVSQDNMSYGKEQTEDRSLSTYTYISLNYKIDSDRRVSLRVPFLYNTAGQNRYGDQIDSEMKLNDIFFVYNMSDLGYIGDVDLAGNFRVYFPTSEAAQNTGMIAKFRAEVFFDYSIGRFSSISYGIKPDYYWQQRTATFNSDTARFDDGNFVRDPRSTNKQAELEQFIELNADINKYFSLKPRIGLEEAWYHSSAAEDLEGNHVTKAFYQAAVSIRPARGINFLVGMTNTTILNSNRGKDIQWGQPENTNYFVMTNAFLF